MFFVVWLSKLASLLAFGPGWWHAQLAYALAGALFACWSACRSGGSLWVYWGTCVYVSVLLPAAVLLIAIWRSTLPWPVCFVVTAASAIFFRYWNLVADFAFRRMILKHGAEKRQKLKEIHATPRLVFCATAWHTGKHPFFSKDLLYAPHLREGLPPKR